MYQKGAVDKVGDKDVQFLDVRDDDTYKAGHLKGTLQCSLKEFDTPEAQTEMYNLAKDQDGQGRACIYSLLQW